MLIKQGDEPGVIFGKGKEYIKKPIAIKAWQIKAPFTVETKEGVMEGKDMDYLLRGIEGELYVCDKQIFEKSYVEIPTVRSE